MSKSSYRAYQAQQQAQQASEEARALRVFGPIPQRGYTFSDAQTQTLERVVSISHDKSLTVDYLKDLIERYAIARVSATEQAKYTSLTVTNHVRDAIYAFNDLLDRHDVYETERRFQDVLRQYVNSLINSIVADNTQRASGKTTEEIAEEMTVHGFE